MPVIRTSKLSIFVVLITFTPCQKASLQTVRVSCCRVSLVAISIWGRCGACGDESGFPDSTVVKMKSEVGFPSSINHNASGDPIAALDRRRDVSDALYSEGPFVDNSTWHAESSIPPINRSSPCSVPDTRTSAFGVETQFNTRDEQIHCLVRCRAAFEFQTR